MPFSKNKIILLIAGAVLILAVVVLVFIGKKPAPGSVPKLAVWGIDKRDVFQTLGNQYKTLHPGAEITYTQLDPAAYEDAVIKALAAGKGPDVLFISNHSLPKLRDILAPLSSPVFTAQNFRDAFPTAAAEDFIWKDQIYAVPLYMDTLVLIYNRDLFDQASIPSPPKSWAEFQDLIPKLRVLNSRGQIIRAAAAAGGTEKTVARAADILSLLLLQNGVQMTDGGFKSATFASDKGTAALDFYLQFSNPASASYTWNEAQKYSLDSFAAGETAMVFGYKSDLDAIRVKSPFLNVGVAPMPQTSETAAVNYPSYGGLAVSASTVQKGPAQTAAAWDFAGLVTVSEDNAKTYVNATLHPPALRSLISALANNPDFGIFAKQALSARSWYTADYDRIKDILDAALSRVINGQSGSAGALREAQDSVSLLMR